jgi:hypothetical protein
MLIGIDSNGPVAEWLRGGVQNRKSLGSSPGPGLQLLLLKQGVKGFGGTVQFASITLGRLTNYSDLIKGKGALIIIVSEMSLMRHVTRCVFIPF